MVAEARTWVDVEGAVREWARDNVASVDRRVFYGYVENASLPQIALFRIAGPDDRCLIQFDVWASSKAQAATTAAALATAADHLSRYVKDGVLLKGAAVEDSSWAPDGENEKLSRYRVDVTFSASALS